MTKTAVLLMVGLAGAARAAPLPGLVAEYRDGERQVTVVVPTPSFTLRAEESVHPDVRPAFSARYTGALNVVVPGKYRFEAAPATLAIAGKVVGDAPVELKAGLVPLTIEYRRTTPAARLQVLWQGEGFAREPLPASSLVHESEPAAVAETIRLERGRALAEQLNCRGCHDPASQKEWDRGRGPILSAAGARLFPSWIYRWLENPTAYRASARMPALALSEPERRDVTAYLATLGGPLSVADTSVNAQAVARGQTLFESIGCRACHGETAGKVSGPVGSKMPRVAVREFLLDPKAVEPTGRMPGFNLRQGEAGALAAFVASKRNPALEQPVPVGGDAARGRALVIGRGCLGCHTVEENGKPLRNTLVAPPMQKLAAGRGCLAADPPPRAPRFRLTPEQRADLALAVTQPEVAPAPAVALERAIAYHNCRACHDPASPAHEGLVETAPPLDDVGGRLLFPWLKAALTWNKLVRPWMKLRMPQFREQAADDIALGLVAVSGAPREAPARAHPDPLLVREGVRHLGRGEEGLACITCHPFAGFDPKSGTPGPDLATVGERLRPDYFQRWLLDPQRVRPATQMPAFFADMDRTVAEKKIAAMYLALGLGRQMPAPEGASTTGTRLPLAPAGGPMVFRTYVAAGAPRSILVGFPSGISYAFDAEECRVAFAWTGGFVDAAPVWLNRGGAPAMPLGPLSYVPAKGTPLRIGAPGRLPRTRFRGYTLEASAVVFRYEVDGVPVRERIGPGPRERTLVRAFELQGRRLKEVSFLAGEGSGADVTADGAEWRAGEKRFVAAAREGQVRFSIVVTTAAPAAASAAPAR